MQALQDGASQEELDRLMNELARAFDEFMRELAERMGDTPPLEMDIPPDAQFADSNDIMRMMQEIRDLAQTGSMEAARQMMAELQRMLEALRNGMRAMPNASEIAKARKAMDDLRDLTRRQQELMDQTFRDLRGRQEGAMPQGQQGEAENGEADERRRTMSERAGDQGALRQRLGELMLQMDEMLGQIPGNLGEADKAMEEATRALSGGQGRKGVQQQGKALEALRQAAEGMAEQMARRMGGGLVRAPRGLRPGVPVRRDPNNQRSGGASGPDVTGNDVKIPTEAEIKRARELLDELRKRSGERHRPVFERDYIDRLLRQF